MRKPTLTALLLLLTVSASAIRPALGQAPPPPTTTVAKTAPGILTKDEAAALLPTSVYFRGQSAPVQSRNSSGIRFSADSLMLVVLVDTSGYSSSVQQRYQAYLLTEAPLVLGGHPLPPGAYGIGFIANDTFLVMDIGAHQLFTATYSHDTDLRRPTPLQILPDPANPAGYRLYSGRSFIPFTGTAGAGATATP